MTNTAPRARQLLHSVSATMFYSNSRLIMTNKLWRKPQENRDDSDNQKKQKDLACDGGKLQMTINTGNTHGKDDSRDGSMWKYWEGERSKFSVLNAWSAT